MGGSSMIGPVTGPTISSGTSMVTTGGSSVVGPATTTPVYGPFMSTQTSIAPTGSGATSAYTPDSEIPAPPQAGSAVGGAATPDSEPQASWQDEMDEEEEEEGPGNNANQPTYNVVSPNKPVPSGTFATAPYTVTVLVGHGYSVKGMLGNYFGPGNTAPAAGTAMVAAIACQAENNGIKEQIANNGLLPPSWYWPDEPVSVKSGIKQLVRGIPDLLQEASNQWSNNPDFTGITLQIVADPTAANGLTIYQGNATLPSQLGKLTPQTLVSQNPVGPAPMWGKHAASMPWYISTITIPRDQLPSPNANGSLYAPTFTWPVK
jgi:hypothetical protein